MKARRCKAATAESKAIGGRGRFTPPEPPDGYAGPADWVQAQRREGGAWTERDRALDALFATRPTTVAGVASALAYVSEFEFGDAEAGVLILNRHSDQEASAFLASVAAMLAAHLPLPAARQ